MPVPPVFQLASTVYPAYNTAYKLRTVQGIVNCMNDAKGANI